MHQREPELAEPALGEGSVATIGEEAHGVEREAGADGPPTRPASARWRARWAAAALVVYPSYVLGSVLRPSTNYHLRNPYADPLLLTDYDGGVRLAFIIKSMRWPWSTSPLVSAPDGESVLRWQNAAQGVQMAAIYVLTRVFEPVFTLNLIVFVGWVLTGVAVYGLARRLGFSRVAAVAAGLAAQMLPSMPTMASNYTSYVYVAVPVYAVSRAIDVARAPSHRNGLMLVFALTIALFFDPYWFFFSLGSAVVVLVVNLREVTTWLRTCPRWFRWLVGAASAAPIGLIALVLLLDEISGSSTVSRPLGVAHPGLVRAGLRAPMHWFRSNFEGLGPVIGTVALVTVVVVLVKRTERWAATVAVVTAFLILLSTDTGIDTPWFRIGSLAEYARFVFPGVRFFQRAALIAEALLCIFAVLGVTHLARRLRSTPPRYLAIAVVVMLAIVDLGALERRVYSRRWDDFGAFREILAEESEPTIAALPFERYGRSWFELSMFGDIRTVNPIYESERAVTTAVAASRGPSELAAYLASLGTTHVLAIKGPARYPTTYELGAPWFVERGTMVLNAYEAEREVVALYELRPQPGDSFCTDCNLGGGFDFLGDASAEGDVDILEVAPSGDVRWWWMNGSRMEIWLEMEQFADLDLEATLGVTFGNAPCALPRSITVAHAGWSDAFDLVGSENPTVYIPVTSADLDEPVVVTARGEICTIPGDPRDFMVQVFRPTFTTAPEG
jgi:hypothetical protein